MDASEAAQSMTGTDWQTWGTGLAGALIGGLFTLAGSVLTNRHAMKRLTIQPLSDICLAMNQALLARKSSDHLRDVAPPSRVTEPYSHMRFAEQGLRLTFWVKDEKRFNTLYSDMISQVESEWAPKGVVNFPRSESFQDRRKAHSKYKVAIMNALGQLGRGKERRFFRMMDDAQREATDSINEIAIKHGYSPSDS